MENQIPYSRTHDMGKVMENLTQKMNQIQHMFPIYHETLKEMFKDLKMAQSNSTD
jgi:hypothetical protein